MEPIYGLDEELEKLMERAQVNHAQRLTFRGMPDRAKELLRYALARPKIRNPAAYALTRIRAEQERKSALTETERVEDLPADPLSIEELESSLAFARQHGAPAIAIERIEAALLEARSLVRA